MLFYILLNLFRTASKDIHDDVIMIDLVLRISVRQLVSVDCTSTLYYSSTVIYLIDLCNLSKVVDLILFADDTNIFSLPQRF